MRSAGLTHEGATGDGHTAARELVDEVVEALVARNPDRLRAAAGRLRTLADAARRQRDEARAAWSASRTVLGEAGGRRAALQDELVVARRTEALGAHPAAVVELVALLRRRERLAAAVRSQGVKQRLNSALRKHTEALLDKVRTGADGDGPDRAWTLVGTGERLGATEPLVRTR